MPYEINFCLIVSIFNHLFIRHSGTANDKTLQQNAEHLFLACLSDIKLFGQDPEKSSESVCFLFAKLQGRGKIRSEKQKAVTAYLTVIGMNTVKLTVEKQKF